MQSTKLQTTNRLPQLQHEIHLSVLGKKFIQPIKTICQKEPKKEQKEAPFTLKSLFAKLITTT